MSVFSNPNNSNYDKTVSGNSKVSVRLSCVRLYASDGTAETSDR